MQEKIMQGFFITGTGTEVGKTIVTALLTLGLNRFGIHCCPIKPVASGGVWMGNDLVSDDAIQYQRIAQRIESAKQLNPYCLEYPASPCFAAELENKTIPVHQIVNKIRQFSGNYDAVLIEGAGGWLVPISQEIWIRDMAGMFGLPIIVVAANVLGTVNHTLLTIESIRQSGQTVAGVIFTHPTLSESNRIHKNNIQTVAQTADVQILGEIPHLPQKWLLGNDTDQLWHGIKDSIQWNTLTQLLHTAKSL